MMDRTADLMNCSHDELVELKDIRIDTSKPVPERMAAFLNQIHNPYLFKVDGLIVRAVYPPDAKCRFSDAVSSLMACNHPVHHRHHFP